MSAADAEVGSETSGSNGPALHDKNGSPVIAVVIFPGTNCELDVAWAIGQRGGRAQLVLHDESDLTEYDGLVIAGGFAHGDYLRPGAIARFSPVMGAVRQMADSGRPVIGICNGFQVLCEAGILPGALQKNAGLKFICGPATLRVESADTALTVCCTEGAVLQNVPINHFEGNFTADEATLDRIEAGGQVVFRYCDSDGNSTLEANPNGSANSIAGICNEERNVVGLMPHPERAIEVITGSESGIPLIDSILAFARDSQRGDARR